MLDSRREDDEADNEHHQEQYQKVEDEPEPTYEAAEAPEALRTFLHFLPHRVLRLSGRKAQE
jgi:hypothetical protein